MLKIVYENYAEYHDDKNLVEALSSIQSSYENLSYEETVIMADIPLFKLVYNDSVITSTH